MSIVSQLGIPIWREATVGLERWALRSGPANIDCTERALARLEGILERTVARTGRRAAIVGQSRGGMMARVLAVRRPELVERIVCLGSPLTDPYAIHPVVRIQAEAIALFGSAGVPGTFSRSCRDGACCTQANAELTADFPEDVAFTSVYSRSDGIVAWHSCLDPAAEHVEVKSSHIGMALNPDVFRVVGQTLAESSALRTG